MNIVIPMAGAGSRFVKAGYKDPKPLIPIHGFPMIRIVIENLKPRVPHRFIFICQKEHVKSYGLAEKFKEWAPGCEVVEIEGITEGAACTVLSAQSFIDSNDPLMIANSDQYVDVEIDSYLTKIESEGWDGLIMTMKADDPKWSYAGVGMDGLVTKVVEKTVISQDATVGIYNFKKGCDFVSGAREMIDRDERVNNEFYVAPVYNQLISAGKKIGIFNIGAEGNGMYGLGIPSDLEYFLDCDISSREINKWK